ncbi:hypothetical protein BD560DRAFT_399647 [Blakeslea trispora]|nr:hypothetical protein BD560DRAFT_399647 [Blakeslea trispora]
MSHIMSLSVQDEYSSFHEVSSNYSFRDSYTSLDSSQQQQQSRKIYSGEHETMLKHLYGQIEQLTLSNARLVRANRVLKLECDRIVEEKTAQLQQALKVSVEQNIRLQRANRILQDEYTVQTEKLNHIKQDQIRQMKIQLAGKTPCDATCCFTGKSSKEKHEESSPPVTLTSAPPSPSSSRPASTTSVPNRHMCRPIIKSHIPGGNLAVALEQENNQLRDGMDILMNDRDALYQLLKDKEEDNETLKHELKVKDDIVKQLENDFEKMELEVTDLQKDWCYGKDCSPGSFLSELHSFPSVPT